MSILMEERDKAFYKAYRKAWDDGARTHGEAVDAALASPTDRLWISERYARIVIDKFRAGESVGSSRMGMYEDMWRQFKAARQSPALQYLPDSVLIRHVIYKPTAGFPLSRRTANRIIKRMRKMIRNGFAVRGC